MSGLPLCAEHVRLPRFVFNSLFASLTLLFCFVLCLLFKAREMQLDAQTYAAVDAAVHAGFLVMDVCLQRVVFITLFTNELRSPSMRRCMQRWLRASWSWIALSAELSPQTYCPAEP